MNYADLIVEAKTDLSRQIFTYQIPDQLQNQIEIGKIVSVAFGRRKIRALIIKIHYQKPDYPIKPIASISQIQFSRARIQTLLWISKYYLASAGEALKIFLPPSIIRPRKASENTQSFGKIPDIKLSPDQESVYKNIKQEWSNGQKKQLLLGVTGSGKTEIYIKLIRDIVRDQGQVIYLLPEIFLASVILKRLANHFGSKIAIVHSRLSKSETNRIYERFSSSELPIIIGPRSCLLVLPKNLKLIIIDEEHDNSYKQEQSPHYDARLLAEKIANYENARLVLGSATPQIETFYRAKNGEFCFHELKNRYQQSLPDSLVVDMRNEIKAKNYSVLSRELKERLETVLRQRKQALVFLNRRGLATFVSCRECGHVEICPNCNLPLVHHIAENKNSLNCHQCDFQKPLPYKCDICGSLLIKSFGTGIQKVETELKQFFLDKRILRLDTDLKESALQAVMQKVHNNDFDILIGTQIIAKGLDLPNVNLVGIISADTALHFPDYHAAEQTFALITQVSGRSGRREEIGQTVIQTYWPNNHSIACAAKHDYESFYESELKTRQVFDYPPFKKVIRLISQSKDQTKAKSQIRTIAKILKEEKIKFIGPAPAFYKKIRNRFRYHLIIKIPESDRKRLYNLLAPYSNTLSIDIDPVNML